MPMDRKRYPANWKDISRRIRFGRAGNRCEWCGVENYSTILRSTTDGSRYLILGDDGIHYTPDGQMVETLPSEFQNKYTRIVLTVAHLGTPHPDGTPGDKHDKHDVRDENLAALCQRCHLLYDRDEHQANRRETRRQRRMERDQQTGQLRMFPY